MISGNLVASFMIFQIVNLGLRDRSAQLQAMEKKSSQLHKKLSMGVFSIAEILHVAKHIIFLVPSGITHTE